MDTFNNKVPSGPQDYVNFYHTNEEGNIYLDGEGKPFSLQRTLTEPAQVISPKDLWDSTQTRHGTHAPYQPRGHKANNSTTIDPNTNPQLHIPPMVSPIKTGNDDDDSGPSEQHYNRMRQMLDVAFQTVMAKTPKDKFDQVMDSFTSALHQISNGNTPAPNSNEEIENKLKEVEKQNRTLTHEKFLLNQDLKTKVAETEQNFQTKLADYQKEIQAKDIQIQRFQNTLANQVSEQVNIKQVEFQNQLHQFAAEKQTEQQNLHATYQSQIQDLETQKRTDFQNYQQQIKQLQQQLQFTHTVQPPPSDPNLTFNSTLNNSAINELSSSILLQTQIAKQQLLIQAKPYDGKNPTELYHWLDEVNRLSSQNGYTHIEVATQTSRGSVHRYITELVKQNLEWDKIKTLLRERFSDCSSSAAAQNKLASLKQNGKAMHEYVASFGDLLDHAHNLKPSEPATKLLANQFIEGIDEENKYIRNKLREGNGTCLEWYFNKAMELQHKQEIRAIDFKPNNDTRVNKIAPEITDIAAIRNNSLTCHKCGSPDHFIKDCPDNKPQANYNHQNNFRQNPKPQQDNQLERLIEALNKLVNKDQHQSNNRQSSYESNNRQPSYDGNKRQAPYASHNRSYQDNRQGNYRQSNNTDNRSSSYQSKAPNNRQRLFNRHNDNKGEPHRQTAGTNAIEDYNLSDVDLDNYGDEGTGYCSDTSDTGSKN